jgi:hypothetical protein
MQFDIFAGTGRPRKEVLARQELESREEKNTKNRFPECRELPFYL